MLNLEAVLLLRGLETRLLEQRLGARGVLECARELRRKMHRDVLGVQ